MKKTCIGPKSFEKRAAGKNGVLRWKWPRLNFKRRASLPRCKTLWWIFPTTTIAKENLKYHHHHHHRFFFLLFYQCSFWTRLRQRVLFSCIRLIMVKRYRIISVSLESMPFVQTSVRIIGAITLNNISLKEKMSLL